MNYYYTDQRNKTMCPARMARALPPLINCKYPRIAIIIISIIVVIVLLLYYNVF